MRAFVLGLMLACAAPAALAEPLPAAAAQRDFEAANERALEGDNAGAAGLYRSLIERGVEHPDLFYNLGTVLAAEGEDVEAALALERALRLDPGHADAQENLRRLRARLRPKQAAPEPGDAGSVAFADVLAPIVSRVPAGPVSWAFLAAWALLFLFWGLGRRATGGARRALYGLAITSAALALLFGALTAAHAFVANEPLGVAKQALELRKGPDERFDTTGPVAPAARLRIVDHDGAWLEVLQQDGTTGWVVAKHVARL